MKPCLYCHEPVCDCVDPNRRDGGRSPATRKRDAANRKPSYRDAVEVIADEARKIGILDTDVADHEFACFVIGALTSAGAFGEERRQRSREGRTG